MTKNNTRDKYGFDDEVKLRFYILYIRMHAFDQRLIKLLCCITEI